jgi:hypothetical protein
MGQPIRPAPHTQCWKIRKHWGRCLARPEVVEITGKAALREPKGKRLAQLTRLREAAIAMVQSKGQWESLVCGDREVRVMCVKHGQLSILYKTPFQNMWGGILPGASKSTGYLLEIFHDGTPTPINQRPVVLGLMWDENKPTVVLRFIRGDWENEILEVASQRQAA